ncbi:glycosyl transferase family 39 [Longimycelium tulufanense]|uniref:Glycosyl transferase family 39 n=1 Tax=Longimycelium tulufanense TaxID=907463 RepID=A0A8J3FTP5_9PSEU|nr:glycosyltransferase family 39 protein [Longimycelium tulufanense]GGM42725.1 glycosyl transferase family 39 [Longimycelium tulufanense]
MHLPVESQSAEPTVPPFAWKSVSLVAAAVAALLLGVVTRYGYDGDETYFLVAGHHVDWSYVDQPPLLPLLARALDSLFGGGLIALRLPGILLGAGGVLLTASIARELGGGRRAQVIAAASSAVSPFMLYNDHVLTTMTVDVFLWTLITWLLVRWVRVRRDGLLLWAGLATAVAMQGKYLIASFWPVVIASALVVGPRELVRRPLLWAGAAVTVLTAAPSLIWQARHGWPQLAMTTVIAGEQEALFGGHARLWFVPFVLVSAGLVVGTVLFGHGLWRLLRSDRLRPYRFLGWAFLGLLALLLWSDGRTAYAGGMYPLFWAVSAVELQLREPARWWRWVPTWPVFALTALLSAHAVLPVFPVSEAAKAGNLSLLQAGWPKLADTVSDAYHALPAPTRHHLVLIGETYEYASVLDRFGPRHGLPPVYSGHRGYWYFGRPADDVNAVLVVGGDEGFLRQNFADTRPVAQFDDGRRPPNPVLAAPKVWLCTGPREPWSRLWPKFYHLRNPPEITERV